MCVCALSIRALLHGHGFNYPYYYYYFTCGWSWDLDSVSWKLVLFQFLWLGIGQNSVYCSNKDFYGYLNFYFISSQTLFIASFSSLSFLSRVHEPVLFYVRWHYSRHYASILAALLCSPLSCLPTPPSHPENYSPYCNKDQFLKSKVSLCDFPSY